MTTTDDLDQTDPIREHIEGTRRLSPSELAKLRQARDHEDLERARIEREAEVAAATQEETDRAAANTQLDADIESLIAKRDLGREKYATAVTASREFDILLDEYERDLRRVTKQAQQLGRDTSALPRRINPKLIRLDLDRERRGIRPAHRHEFLTPAPSAEDETPAEDAAS